MVDSFWEERTEHPQLRATPRSAVSVTCRLSHCCPLQHFKLALPAAQGLSLQQSQGRGAAGGQELLLSRTRGRTCRLGVARRLPCIGQSEFPEVCG